MILLICAIVHSTLAVSDLQEPSAPPAFYSVVDLGFRAQDYDHGENEAYRLNDDAVVACSGIAVNEVREWSSRAFVWENGTLQRLEAPGARISWAHDINDHGVVVGVREHERDDGTARHHAVMWRSGAMIELASFEPGAWSAGNAINEMGQVVGRAKHPRGVWVPAMWDDDGIIALGDDDALYYGGAADINSRGDVVGNLTLPGRLYSTAALWRDGELIDLGTLGGVDSWARGINDKGQVVGGAANQNGDHHAFLWSGGNMIDLGTLGGRTSGASAINGNGQVVGSSDKNDWPPSRAFVWQDGQMYDLNMLIDRPDEVELWSARDINERGQILVRGVANHEFRYFLLTPTGRSLEPVVEIIEPSPTPRDAEDSSEQQGVPDEVREDQRSAPTCGAFGTPLATLTLLSLLGLRLASRRRQTSVGRCRSRRCLKHGLCLACGYDLRGSTERCPECATGVEA